MRKHKVLVGAIVSVLVLGFAWMASKWLTHDKQPKNGFKDHYVVIDRTDVCAEALEYLGTKDDYDYYLPCLKSTTVFIQYEDGSEENLVSALKHEHISIESLMTKDLDIIKVFKVDDGLMGTLVVETLGTYKLSADFYEFTIVNYTDKEYFFIPVPYLEIMTATGWEPVAIDDSFGVCGNRDTIYTTFKVLIDKTWYPDLKPGTYRVAYHLYKDAIAEGDFITVYGAFELE